MCLKRYKPTNETAVPNISYVQAQVYIIIDRIKIIYWHLHTPHVIVSTWYIDWF